MDKLIAIKIKISDNPLEYSDPIPIGADAANITYSDDNLVLADVIENIETDLSNITTALFSDVGKVPKVKTVQNGKVVEWEFDEINNGSGNIQNIDWTDIDNRPSINPGMGTNANHRAQHVFGQYNISDSSPATSDERGNYIEIIGNGSSSLRSNARTLDWDGNEVLAGKLTVGTSPVNNMDVATKKYVDDAVAENTDPVVISETISQSVTDWLDDHIDSSSDVVIDDSLTVTGAAADSKKVGDELTELKADLSELDSDLEAKINNAYITNTASGANASFDDGADGVPVKDLTVQIVPYQAGTGDPSTENVRLISGWTGCNISRSGLNLASIDSKYFKQLRGNSATYSNGTITTGGGTSSVSACGMLYPIKPGVTYYYMYRRSAGGTSYPWVRTYEVKPTDYNSATVRKLKNENSSMETNGIISGNFTAQENERYLFIGMYKSSSSAAFTLTDFTLGVGAFATDNPYNGAEYQITFPTEAGTVYGGTLDVTTGVLTVDRKLVDLGDRNWSLLGNTGSRQAWVAYFSEIKPPANGNTPYDAISSEFKGVSYNASWLPGVFAPTASSSPTGVAFCVESGKYADASEFKTAVTGVQFCYAIAEPQTYQLTPTEVSTLLGQNNIWADCGDTTVDYRADTKLYIEKLTAPSEDDMTANQNIPSGTYFQLGNELYLSTTTIPAGDTINPGTNCTRMSLASALNALNA